MSPLEFFIDIILPAHCVTRVVSDSNRWVPGIFRGDKDDNFITFMCRFSWDLGNVNLLETSGPLLTGNGIALPLPSDRTIKIIHISILYGSAGIGLRLHCYSVYRRICLREEDVAEFRGRFKSGYMRATVCVLDRYGLEESQNPGVGKNENLFS